MAVSKLYPFSLQKHGHDIEFYKNRLFNVIHDLRMGDGNLSRIERLEAEYEEVTELLLAVNNSRDGVVSYLTGPQIAKAKEVVFWASEQRAATMRQKVHPDSDPDYFRSDLDEDLKELEAAVIATEYYSTDPEYYQEV